MNAVLNRISAETLSFLRELIPAAVFSARAFGWCVLILTAALIMRWGREKIKAAVEMRPSRGLVQICRQACVTALKKNAVPQRARKKLYVAAPLFALVFALFFFFVLPVNGRESPHYDFGLLYLTFVASCTTYAFIAGGWSGATRYGFFGAVRLIAQSLACQLILAAVFVTVLMSAGTGDLYRIIQAQAGAWFAFVHFPLFVLYLLCVAMLTAQAPFGAPKSERDLAGGVYAEYGGFPYLLFLMGEDVLTLLCAVSGAVLFLGGTLPVFGIGGVPAVVWLGGKTAAVVFVLTLMQTALPAWRTDRLMNMCFKAFLPLALAWLAGTAVVLYFMRQGGAG